MTGAGSEGRVVRNEVGITRVAKVCIQYECTQIHENAYHQEDLLGKEITSGSTPDESGVLSQV